MGNNDQRRVLFLQLGFCGWQARRSACARASTDQSFRPARIADTRRGTCAFPAAMLRAQGCLDPDRPSWIRLWLLLANTICRYSREPDCAPYGSRNRSSFRQLGLLSVNWRTDFSAVPATEKEFNALTNSQHHQTRAGNPDRKRTVPLP